MKKLLAIALLLLPSCCMVAQRNALGTIEMTNTDFVHLPEINSLRLTLFGVRLGQTEQEAGAALATKAKRFERTSFVNPETSANDTPSILLATKKGYFAEIHLTHGRVYKICLYSSGGEYLVGESKLLLGNAAAGRDSSERLRLLGREDSLIRDHGETFYLYKKKGIRVTGHSLELVTPS